MSKSSEFVLGLLATHLLFQANTVNASTEVEEAIGLIKEMHADRCQLQQVRGQLMVAHQDHDDSAVHMLLPQMESLNQRLKPLEDRLKALKLRITQNLDDKNAL